METMSPHRTSRATARLTPADADDEGGAPLRSSRTSRATSTSRAISRRPAAVPLAALLGAAGLLLASCTDGGEPGGAVAEGETVASQSKADTPSPTADTSATTTTPTTSEKPGIAVDFDSLQQVDPSTFREGTRQALKFVVGGTAGECFVGGEFVTCVGTAAGDVPDVDMPPFSGRPGAVMVGAAGVAYTIAEGAPPARAELETGQWVNFGAVRCAKPDDARLACVSEGAAIQVEGAGRDITTQGTLYDAADLHSTATDAPPSEYSTGTDVLVQAPMTCGAMEGHRLADVVDGEITCEEAMGVLDEYDSRKHSEGGGNTLSVEFDGWMCSSPTAARSQELRATTVCEHGDRGIRVQAPM
ncbi:hypothetical protein ACFWGD_02715 [Corynebacterium sp. NPDC060344]|uniref:hypothetical protein n=1 Tax=Corynebacterium sp. NPDC060344 TaxID=3347101 RepID=UPI00365D13CB